MAARETYHHSLSVVDFFSADSSRGELSERDNGESSFQQSLKSPPLVALSLRTRESSALALKHIFDQVNSSADSTPFNNNSSIRAFEKKDNIAMHALDKDGPSAAGLQGARNHASPLAWQAAATSEEHRMRLSEFDVSFMKAQAQAFSANNPVFGSPVSTPSLLQNASDNTNLPVHQGFLPWAVSRPNPSSPSIRQSTAQLTIFYSGTVNVYDDVPADKANAIMLLAGTGNSWSTKPANEGDKERISTQLNSPSPPPPHAGMSLPVSLAMAAPTVTTTTATTTTSKTMAFSMPSAPSMVTNTIVNTVSTPPPPSPSPSLPTEAKAQAAPKRPHTGIELPQARKASLARFLEKRRDRVQVKQQQAGDVEEEKCEMSRDETPSSPKQPCMSGLSLPTGNSNKAGNQCSSLPSTTQHPCADAAAAIASAMMALN